MLLTHRPTLFALVALSLAACEPDAPIGESPDGAVIDRPATDAPATDAPLLDAPATDTPAADRPVTDTPAADAPDAPVCEPARGTFDCGTEQIARTICAGLPVCHVCVQTTDAMGTAVQWAAIETPAACGCPSPTVRPPADAGPDVAVDASTDASTDGGRPAGAACAADGECASGLLCCYPCGIPGCTNQCLAPMDGHCPLRP